MRPKTILGVVRTYFPRLSARRANALLWEHTGYPGFWNIPEDGNTPEQCLRKQLRMFRKHGRGCYRCGAYGRPMDGIICVPCVPLMRAEFNAAEASEPTAGPPVEAVAQPPSDKEG